MPTLVSQDGRNRERFLVVDAHEQACTLGPRLLTAIATAGHDGVAVLHPHEHIVDLATDFSAAFVDVDIAFGAGAELVRRMRTAHPGFPVIPYTSTAKRRSDLPDVVDGQHLGRDPECLIRPLLALANARAAYKRMRDRLPARPAGHSLDPDPLDLDGLLLRYREAHVQAALRRQPTNLYRASGLLGVPESTLRSWIDPASTQRKFTPAAPDPVASGHLVADSGAGPSILIVDLSAYERGSPLSAASLAPLRAKFWWLVREYDVMRCVARSQSQAVVVHLGARAHFAAAAIAAYRLSQDAPYLPVLIWTDTVMMAQSEPLSQLGLLHEVVVGPPGEALLESLIALAACARDLDAACRSRAAGDVPALPDRLVCAGSGLYALEANLERCLIERAIETRNGSRSRAAAALMITPQSLWRRTRRLGL